MKAPRLLAACTIAVLFPVTAAATTYQVDSDHTNVGFKVRHLFTHVQGRFDRFQGTIDFDPAKPEATKVEGKIEAASINTNVAQRDTHLRSEDFFDVQKYPNITFVSTKSAQIDAAKKSGKLEGKLTIHGIEKPVVLDVSYLGAAKDPWGNMRAGFSARTTINRKDFGLTWNETLESGGLLVGDEIQIEIDAEGMVPAAK
jgi:polyisoprenoid-binding protein YceI